MSDKYVEQLVIGPVPPPLGGVSSSVENLLRLFKNKSLPFDVFSTSSGGAREDLYSAKGLNNYIFSVRLVISLFLKLARIRDKFCCHVFVVSNSAFLRDIVLLIVCRAFGAKVIIHFHSKMQGEMFLSKGWSWLLRFGLSLGHRVLVLSEDHAKHFLQYVAEDKLMVLENYVFADDFKGGRESSDWLYVGRLSEKKGIYDLINAVSICARGGFSELKIHCLGVAETDGAHDDLDKHIADMGVTDNFVLHGVVTGEAKSRFFKECGGLLFPSHFENSPVVLKEAVAAGMAVVSSDIDANKSVLDRVGNALYFEVGNSEDLARKIICLIDDELLKEDLRNKASSAFLFDDSYAWDALLKADT